MSSLAWGALYGIVQDKDETFYTVFIDPQRGSLFGTQLPTGVVGGVAEFFNGSLYFPVLSDNRTLSLLYKWNPSTGYVSSVDGVSFAGEVKSLNTLSSLYVTADVNHKLLVIDAYKGLVFNFSKVNIFPDNYFFYSIAVDPVRSNYYLIYNTSNVRSQTQIKDVFFDADGRYDDSNPVFTCDSTIGQLQSFQFSMAYSWGKMVGIAQFAGKYFYLQYDWKVCTATPLDDMDIVYDTVYSDTNSTFYYSFNVGGSNFLGSVVVPNSFIQKPVLIGLSLLSLASN